MDNTELFLELGLGTRLRRLMETLSADADAVYAAAGLPFKASFFYIFYALDQRGPMPIGDIAKLAGFSHSAVSQTVKKLVKDGVLALEPGPDARQKIVGFSVAGEALLRQLKPLWAAFDAAARDAIAESGTDLIGALTGLEARLAARGFMARVQEKAAAGRATPLEIVPYEIKYRQAFYDINMAWVSAYFKVEPMDEAVLSDPEGMILGKGGEIYIALEKGEAIGAVALKSEGDGVFELSKLGVTTAARGKGAGRALSLEVIRRFRARGGKLLYLETNKTLTPAIRLYESLGFVEKPSPMPAHFERANHYMEWMGA